MTERSPEGAVRVVLVDDHAMFRTAVSDGLGVLLGAGTQVLEAEEGKPIVEDLLFNNLIIQ